MISPKDVTIIIPHLGGTKETEYALDQCLLSLKETVPDIKIVLAINGKFVCQGHDGLEELSNVIMLANQGQCVAVNAAIATTNTPWVFVTNDDMIYPPDWFNKLTMGVVHPEGKGIKCISPKLVEPRPGASTFDVYFCGGAGGDFDKQKFYEYEANREIKVVDVAVRNGFNLPFLISRELWDTVGGYDVNFDPWGSNSDSDLLYKIKLAGIQPYQNTNSIVYHFSQTSGTFEPRNQAVWQKNWDYFIKKWGFPRTDEGIWEATFDMPDKERIFRPDWAGKYNG